MRTFAKKIENRKELVKRLEELTGLKSRYTFVPRCAYEVGAFTVEKDGVLTVTDGADESIIQTLKDEGLIGEQIEELPPVLPEIPVNIAPAEGILPAEISTEERELEDVMDEDGEPSGETESGDWVTDTEYEQEADEESAVSLGIRDADDGITENEPTGEEALPGTDSEDGFPLNASISLPLTNHTATTLKNLICLVYTRGEQISKATGGEFLIEKDFVDALLDEPTIHTVGQLQEFLSAYQEEHGNAMLGFRIEGDRITFDGFTNVPDADHLETYKRLAVAMNKMALTQKRIQAKGVDAANEKYALRIWLIRLGFNGDDYKHDRKILMEKLSGHTAFRTQADAERAKEKAIKKRDALRAAKKTAEA